MENMQRFSEAVAERIDPEPGTQLRMLDVPPPKQRASRRTVRRVKRTRLAFQRLLRMLEEAKSDGVKVPQWLTYAARRIECMTATLSNAIDSDRQSYLKLRKLCRPKKRKSNRFPTGTRRESRDTLLATWDGRCAYCRGCMKPSQITLDHIVPRSRSGHHTPDNLAIACEACNKAKGNRTPQEWAKDILSTVEGGAE